MCVLYTTAVFTLNPTHACFVHLRVFHLQALLRRRWRCRGRGFCSHLTQAGAAAAVTVDTGVDAWRSHLVGVSPLSLLQAFLPPPHAGCCRGCPPSLQGGRRRDTMALAGCPEYFSHHSNYKVHPPCVCVCVNLESLNGCRSVFMFCCSCLETFHQHQQTT